MVGPDARGVLPEAAVIGLFRGFVPAAASGEQRKCDRKSQKAVPVPWFRHRASLPCDSILREPDDGSGYSALSSKAARIAETVALR